MNPGLARFVVDRRDRDIREAFPGFHRILNLPWYNAWQGLITPAFQTYEVRIDFAPGMNDGEFDYPQFKLPRSSISVHVLNPELKRRVETPALPIPHLYCQPSSEQLPKLCLFWPREQEFSSLDSIAEFIFPWISEWFINYEIWQATGQWASPEAPHDVASHEDVEPSDFASKSCNETSGLSKSRRRRSAWHGASALASLPYFVCRYCIAG
jgi:hypothetical protein